MCGSFEKKVVFALVRMAWHKGGRSLWIKLGMNGYCRAPKSLAQVLGDRRIMQAVVRKR
jgi:hypothetical protein